MTLSNLIRQLPRQGAIAKAVAPRTYPVHRRVRRRAVARPPRWLALTLALSPSARRELRKKAGARWQGLRTRMQQGKQWINGRAEERTSATTRA